jgi:hypothetical protein
MDPSDLATQPPTIIDSDELAAELDRARRYEHDLSVVVLAARAANGKNGRAVAGEGTPPEVTKLPQIVALLTAIALRDVLRSSDVVCYQAADNRFILALTESGGDGASAAVARVGEHFRFHLRLGVRAGVATFPADAYTLDELVAIATSRLAPPLSLGRGALNGAGTGTGAGAGLRSRNGKRRNADTVPGPALLRRDEA